MLRDVRYTKLIQVLQPRMQEMSRNPDKPALHEGRLAGSGRPNTFDVDAQQDAPFALRGIAFLPARSVGRPRPEPPDELVQGIQRDPPRSPDLDRTKGARVEQASRQAQEIQTHRLTMRKDRTEFTLIRTHRRRISLDQIRPHSLGQQLAEDQRHAVRLPVTLYCYNNFCARRPSHEPVEIPPSQPRRRCAINGDDFVTDFYPGVRGRAAADNRTDLESF